MKTNKIIYQKVIELCDKIGDKIKELISQQKPRDAKERFARKGKRK